MGNNWLNDTKTRPFADRHIGITDHDAKSMLAALSYKTIESLLEAAVPISIRDKSAINLKPAVSEEEALAELKKTMGKNRIFKSYIGMGYANCFTPPVIQRNILENPGWYTQYTPYQAEIAQGRLEALINFQTMISDLTGLAIANASLLDEGTAAAEAMNMALNIKGAEVPVFFIDKNCHPQTIAVVETRAWALGVKVVTGDFATYDFADKPFATLVQYPATNGCVHDYSGFIAKTHDHEAIAIVAADILSLCLLKSPGEMNADIAVGNSQRFGVPLGFGGPHAGFLATKDEFKRKMPGRIVGLSKDRDDKPAYRLALATREQHIRRDKATSNICTAQVLLAIMASMYGVYHGPEGLKKIALRTHLLTKTLAVALRQSKVKVEGNSYFDTLAVKSSSKDADQVMKNALDLGINLRRLDPETITVSLDETTAIADLTNLVKAFVPTATIPNLESLATQADIPAALERGTPFMQHPVFNAHHSETQMLRYIRKLEARDLSLTRSMIPLGSCTMKLNATAELMPVSWPEVNNLHPFAPKEQTQGYLEMFKQLEDWLAEITGFSAVSLQPNSGAQGEFAGLLVIRKYHEARGEGHRNVCLIPNSAHGTNPASAVLAGMKVVVVACDDEGNIALDDLKKKVELHAKNLSALMVTYPSTHGVFEDSITEICKIVHSHGGQVYMDGANLQAQIGLCKAGRFGPDVCHMNLHKTFCIPHGGGGPGMGPIAVKEHLQKYLPTHPVVAVGGKDAVGPISAAPWGSPSILPISWMYIRMMGSEGLIKATETAILSANYIAKRLEKHYPVVYRGNAGLVAHECIIDLRGVKKTAGIEVDDIAKRLIDYGFHAPTVSWPVPGSMMIEPTESESKDELDRFCDAMISIREEIAEIEAGKANREVNLLTMAPHPADVIASDSWDRPYSRERAAFPTAATRASKFWPFVSRIDNAYGDRNLVCSCPTVESYQG